MNGIMLILLSTLLLSTVFPGRCSSGNADIRLNAPTSYTALTGDLPVTLNIGENVTLPSQASLELVSTLNHQVITTIPITGEFRDIELTISCGVVDIADILQFTILNSSSGNDFNRTIIAESLPITVTWPKMLLILPKTRRTLEAKIELVISLENEIKCDSKQRNAQYIVELRYSANRNGTVLTALADKEPEIVGTQTIGSISESTNVAITFPCNHTDRAGYYQAVIKFSRSPNTIIAQSNVMEVNWSKQYSLTFSENSIFPCTKGIVVYFEQPECPGRYDKIRVFNQTIGKDSGMPELDYMAEKPARRSDGKVTFACYLFNDTAPGHCFKYISVAGNGAVNEQAELCVPTTDQSAGAIALGAWSEWSDWSLCSTTCGAGQKSRFRTCNNPVTGSESRSCKGEAVKRVPCHGQPCLPSLSSTQPYIPDVDVIRNNFDEDNCPCGGCTLTRPEGYVIASTVVCLSRSGEWEGSPLTWMISVKQGHVIKLQFESFNLRPDKLESWVKVRDGDNSMSALLVNSGGDQFPGPVVSSQNHMRIEFHVAVRRSDLIGQDPAEDFIAKYISFENPLSTTLASSGDVAQNIWENIVKFVGIVICVLVILLSIGFVIQHHIAKRRRRAKLAQTPVHQALLDKTPEPGASTSNQGGSSIEGSANASFAEDGRKQNTGAGGNLAVASSASTSFSPYAGKRSSHGGNKSIPASPFNGPSPQYRTPDSVRKGHHRSKQSPALQRGAGAPIAFQEEEDLSPSAAHGGGFPVNSKHEQINMDSYDDIRGKRRKKKSGACRRREEDEEMETTYMLEKRPPVEGRDSLTRDKHVDDESSSLQKADFIPPSSIPTAGIRDLRDTRESGRLHLKGLHHDPTNGRNQATSPLSNCSFDLSEGKIFPDVTSSRVGTPSDIIINDEFEYDDYIPQLPGSYFTMDPHAYTLTWSQKPQWSAGIQQRTDSPSSLDTSSQPHKV